MYPEPLIINVVRRSKCCSESRMVLIYYTSEFRSHLRMIAHIRGLCNLGKAYPLILNFWNTEDPELFHAAAVTNWMKANEKYTGTLGTHINRNLKESKYNSMKKAS